MLRRKPSSRERQSAPAEPGAADQQSPPEGAARALAPPSEKQLEAVAAILKAVDFAVVLSGTTAKEASAIVEGLLAMIRTAEIETRDGTLRLTTSVGIAEIEPGTTASEILARADGALYAAKAAGRDRSAVWPQVARAAA